MLSPTVSDALMEMCGVSCTRSSCADTVLPAIRAKATPATRTTLPKDWAVGEGVLQVANLGLAARTGAAALALVGALLYLQRNLILLRDALAHLLQLLADVLAVGRLFLLLVDI